LWAPDRLDALEAQRRQVEARLQQVSQELDDVNQRAGAASAELQSQIDEARRDTSGLGDTMYQLAAGAGSQLKLLGGDLKCPEIKFRRNGRRFLGLEISEQNPCPSAGNGHCKAIGTSIMSKLDLLDHPLCLHWPERLTDVPSWHEHIPFAMFLVDILRPGTIVELGTHAGDSYCAFCQVVNELGLQTRCYAIDTWEGDKHAGFYGAEVLEDLRMYHDALYGSFSSLIQSTFDAALEHFTDGSIDLLHIDGYHSYEAVKHDFESWLPKLSSRAVVVLHDTNVHEREFGIRRFWDEIRQEYPHFEFLHGHGLGVLAIGEVSSGEFHALLQSTDQELAVIRDFFFRLGHNLTLKRKVAEKESRLRERDLHLAEKDRQLTEKDGQLAEKDRQLAERDGCLAEREAEVSGLRGTIVQLEQREQKLIEDLQRERSWLVARGWRFFRRVFLRKSQP